MLRIDHFSWRTFKFLVSGMLMTAAASAQAFPDRPVAIVVPYPPGGSVDAIARILAEDLGRRMRQQFVVQNIPGAGGTIGAAKVAQARDDGHTLLFNNFSQSTSNIFYEKLTYDATTDFVGIGSVANVPLLMLARKDFLAGTGADVIKAIRAQPGRFTIANNGAGSGAHLCNLLFKRVTGVDLLEIPYKGAGPAFTDIVGGQVDLLCDAPSTAGAFVRSGQLRALAITSAERSPVMPDVPTFRELGFRDMDFSVWFALFAPKGVSPSHVELLGQALRAAVNEPAFRERMLKLGAIPETPEQATPKALEERMRTESRRWRELVKQQ